MRNWRLRTVLVRPFLHEDSKSIRLPFQGGVTPCDWFVVLDLRTAGRVMVQWCSSHRGGGRGWSPYLVSDDRVFAILPTIGVTDWKFGVFVFVCFPSLCGMLVVLQQL